MNPLDGLRDIHLPVTPGWWPPAPGWWLLVVFAVIAALLLRRPLRARRERRRMRRRLLAEIGALHERSADGEPLPTVLGDLSTLLRRVALARHPREQVAGLAGDAWLRFLDETGGGESFRVGAGRALAQGPFSPVLAGDAVDIDAVLAAARGWLARNG